MARTKSVTPKALAALGADVLAEMLVAHAATDPVLRKKLGMLIAETEGPGKLTAAIDKRIKTIGRSRSFVAWEKRKALIHELDHLRETIATRVATQDCEQAIELLWGFLGIADTVMERMGEGIGNVENIFIAAMEDLGRLSAILQPLDSNALARRVLAYCERGGLGSTDLLISSMSEALGVAGRMEIRRATEAALNAVPSGFAQPDDGHGAAQRRHLAFRLALLADLDNDADAYIAAIDVGGMESTHALEVAERLLRANRPAEALIWLDKPRRHRTGDGDDGTDIDLRISAFQALGRTDEAQSMRWRHFERCLTTEHLRAYLRHLPDFEDFEAEQKALDVAATHKQAERALEFFIEWRALGHADRLVRERLAELDGGLYEILRPAAGALEEKFPEAASLLYRRMVESVLDRASSKQYQYAVRDFQSCARLSSRLPVSGSIETHAAFVALLQKSHGRKIGFWGLMKSKGR